MIPLHLGRKDFTTDLPQHRVNAVTIERWAELLPVLTGSGDPTGVTSAPPGWMYLNDAGGTGTTLYVKETGTGSTGWVAK